MPHDNITDIFDEQLEYLLERIKKEGVEYESEILAKVALPCGIWVNVTLVLEKFDPAAEIIDNFKDNNN